MACPHVSAFIYFPGCLSAQRKEFVKPLSTLLKYNNCNIICGRFYDVISSYVSFVDCVNINE